MAELSAAQEEALLDVSDFLELDANGDEIALLDVSVPRSDQSILYGGTQFLTLPIGGDGASEFISGPTEQGGSTSAEISPGHYLSPGGMIYATKVRRPRLFHI